LRFSSNLVVAAENNLSQRGNLEQLLKIK